VSKPAQKGSRRRTKKGDFTYDPRASPLGQAEVSSVTTKVTKKMSGGKKKLFARTLPAGSTVQFFKKRVTNSEGSVAKARS